MPIKPLTASRARPLPNWLNHRCVCPGRGLEPLPLTKPSPSLTCESGRVNAFYVLSFSYKPHKQVPDSQNKPHTDCEFGEKKCEQPVKVEYRDHDGERQIPVNAGDQEVCDLHADQGRSNSCGVVAPSLLVCMHLPSHTHTHTSLLQ